MISVLRSGFLRFRFYGRKGGESMSEWRAAIEMMLDQIQDEKVLKRICRFIEAIIIYL